MKPEAYEFDLGNQCHGAQKNSPSVSGRHAATVLRHMLAGAACTPGQILLGTLDWIRRGTIRLALLLRLDHRKLDRCVAKAEFP